MSEISEGKGGIRPTLHHFNLKTGRLQEMIDWYATVVGMTSNYQFPGGAWLTNDEANHRLAAQAACQDDQCPDDGTFSQIEKVSISLSVLKDCFC